MMAERIGIVVLAAGAATRFGSSKLTVPIDGVPLVRRAALAALGASAHVVVITGAHRAAVESCIADLAVERVFNPGWADGIGGSIACGVAALSPSCDATIIALGDQALIGSDEFRALIAAHARAPGRIIAATYADVVGPPCLFPPALFGELTQPLSQFTVAINPPLITVRRSIQSNQATSAAFAQTQPFPPEAHHRSLRFWRHHFRWSASFSADTSSAWSATIFFKRRFSSSSSLSRLASLTPMPPYLLRH